MTECEGEGASLDRSAALATYCDLKLHFLALLLPSVIAVGGATLGARWGVRFFAAAVAIGAILALSPIVAAFVLD